MHGTARVLHPTTTAQEYDISLFVALELSRSSWLLAVSVPQSDKISKYRIDAGDSTALLNLLSRLRAEAQRRCGGPAKIISIYEAGLDGFWVHRLLGANGVESHVVDAASIAVDRRSRRVKTDRVDAEKLLRSLMSWARGERQVCSMVRPPSRVEEDERRLTRERGTLVTERVRHVNRIKGLLATQGVFDFEPMRKDRRDRLEELRCWSGQPLPPRLKTELVREIDRLELVITQLREIEAERDLALQTTRSAAEKLPQEPQVKPTPVASYGSQLLRLRGIGPEFASVLSLEAFYRDFRNRRELAAYSGLTPSPWKSGGIDVEQGISKAGNARLRKTMIQLAWLWLRHQPGSALSRWFYERVGDKRGKTRRIAVVALARKLLVALWRYVTEGVVPLGADLKVSHEARRQ
jgi:transposase